MILVSSILAVVATTLPVEPATTKIDRMVKVQLRSGQSLTELPSAVLNLGRWAREGRCLVVHLKAGVAYDRALSALSSQKSVAEVEPLVALPKGVTRLTTVSKLAGLVSDLRQAKAEIEKCEGTKCEVPSLAYLGALLQQWQQRSYPEDQPDWNKWTKAMQHRDAMPPASIGGSGVEDAPAGNWFELGPKNLDTPYRTYWGLPPVTGRINAIAVHPTNSNVIYAGSAGGGVFKSTDGGVNWAALSNGWPTLQVSCITIDPTDPNKVYVGTGDWDGFGGYGVGIMRTTDGGATWTNVGQAQLGGCAVKDIVVDPDSPSTIIAAPGRGSNYYSFLYRSTNGGSTWSSTISTSASWSDLAVGALSGGIRYIYAAGAGNPSYVYRSANHGASWSAISTGLSVSFHDSLALACSPTARDTVYLLAPTDQVVKKSVNAGSSWSSITGNLPTGYNWTQGWYDFHLSCSSGNSGADVLYASLIDLQVDNNADGTWSSMGGPTFSASAILHNDQHCFTVDPSNPNVGYVGCDGGIYRLTFNPTTGTGSVTNLSANLNVVQFYSLATHPTDPTRMLGGTQDNASPWSGGNLASWDNVGGGDGVGVALIKNAPGTMYAGSQYFGYSGSTINVYKTTNSWASSSNPSTSAAGDSPLFIPPMASDPNSTNLYVGTNYLYKYSGSAWTNRLGNQVMAGSGQAVSAIAVAPSNSSRIYTGSSDGRAWMTTNGGGAWTQINTGVVALPNRYLTSISIHPSVQNDILVGLSGTGSGHLYRLANTDAGSRTWINVSGTGVTGLADVPLNGIARDPDDPSNVWYAATDVGVFMTVNAGSTWTNATQPLGLPNVQCNAINTEPGTRFLVVATFGRGMWRIGLPFSVCPTAATVTSGFLIGGGVGQLCVSDDAYLVAFPDTSSLRATIEFSGVSLIQSVSEMTVEMEYSVGRPGLSVNLEFYRYSNSTWVPQTGGAATTSDTAISTTIAASASNYVQSGTRAIRARAIFEPINDEDPAQDGWPHYVDLVRWTIRP